MKIEIEFSFKGADDRLLRSISDRVSQLLIEGEKQMAATAEVMARIGDVLTKVADTRGKVESLNVLMDGMRAKIDALIQANGQVPEEVVAGIEAVFNDASAASAEAQAAIDENPVV